MAVRTMGLLVKGSMWVIAAGALTACGGNGSDGQVSVPDVVGDTQVAASAAISGAGLTVGTVTPQSSSSVASGDVILQDPAAGASVNSGTAVGLFVSIHSSEYHRGKSFFNSRVTSSRLVLPVGG